MDETAKTNAPTSTLVNSPDYHKPFTSPAGLGFWSIIFGLVLPPLGLILAPIAIYKAGQKAKKWALIFGCLGLVAVAAGSVFYVWVYNRHNQISINDTYTYTAYDNYKLYGFGKGAGMTFTKPTTFTDRIGYPKNSANISLTQTANLPGYANAVTVASIDAAVTVPAKKLTPASTQSLSTMINTNAPNDAATNSFKNSILYNFLTTSVAPGSTVKLGAPKSFTSSNIKANAWVYDFSAGAKLANGTPRNINGKLLFILGKQNYYTFAISAIKSNWDANSNTWQQVINSLKIDQ